MSQSTLIYVIGTRRPIHTGPIEVQYVAARFVTIELSSNIDTKRDTCVLRSDSIPIYSNIVCVCLSIMYFHVSYASMHYSDDIIAIRYIKQTRRNVTAHAERRDHQLHHTLASIH